MLKHKTYCLNIKPDKPCANYSKVEGKGLGPIIVVGMESHFVLTSIDSFSNRCLSGGCEVVVSLSRRKTRHHTSEDFETVHGLVSDKADGTYQISYTPRSSGIHTLSVSLGEVLLKGFPISIRVADTNSSSFVGGRDRRTSRCQS